MNKQLIVNFNTIIFKHSKENSIKYKNPLPKQGSRENLNNTEQAEKQIRLVLI